MVLISAGEFLMGNDKHQVSVDGFWIDRTPVTNAEFARFAEATGYLTAVEEKGREVNWRHPLGPESGIEAVMDHPVVCISWHDAAAYAEWAGKRLPTEIEWEKAARGTDGRMYPWGDEAPTAELSNFGRNEGSTTPVGKYSPQGDSPYGCADMAGNVWEWTASDYGVNSKVLRGGSWGNPSGYAHITYRDRNAPDITSKYIGFRCARDVE